MSQLKPTSSALSSQAIKFRSALLSQLRSLWAKDWELPLKHPVKEVKCTYSCLYMTITRWQIPWVSEFASSQSFYLSTLWPTYHSLTRTTRLEIIFSSTSTNAYRLQHLLLCPASPISTLNISYFLLIEVASVQHGCPAITISSNNGNWSMSPPMTPNAFNHCSQGVEKKNSIWLSNYFNILEYHLWQISPQKYLKCSKVRSYHFTPNYLAKKTQTGMAVLSNLPFQPSAETLWYLLDKGELG